MLRVLHISSRIDAIDAPSVIQVHCQRNRFRRREGDVALALPPARILNFTVLRVDFIRHIIPKFIEPQASSEQQPSVHQAEVLLCVAGAVGHVGMSAGSHSEWYATFTRVKADVDFVVVKIGSADEDGRDRA